MKNGLKWSPSDNVHVVALYIFVPHAVWIFSLAVCILSVIPCDNFYTNDEGRLDKYNLIANHFNLAVDIVTLVKAIGCAVVRSCIGCGNMGVLLYVRKYRVCRYGIRQFRLFCVGVQEHWNKEIQPSGCWVGILGGGVNF
jgi:hypothetical protein